MVQPMEKPYVLDFTSPVGKDAWVKSSSPIFCVAQTWDVCGKIVRSKLLCAGPRYYITGIWLCAFAFIDFDLYCGFVDHFLFPIGFKIWLNTPWRGWSPAAVATCCSDALHRTWGTLKVDVRQSRSNPFQHMGVSMGVPQELVALFIFISWKIPSINGWQLGVPSFQETPRFHLFGAFAVIHHLRFMLSYTGSLRSFEPSWNRYEEIVMSIGSVLR